MEPVPLPLCAPDDTIAHALDVLTDAHRVAVVVADDSAPAVIFAGAMRNALRLGKTLLSEIGERESIDPSSIKTAGETLQLTARGPLVELDPTIPANDTVTAVTSLTFDPLLRLDPSGSIVPVLASEVPSEANGGITEDAITFHIRPSVQWHDGTELTSEDVVGTWSDFTARGRDVRVALRSMIRGVTTPNARTVSFQFSTASAAAKQRFAESFFQMYIRPARSRSRGLVGTGAYNVISYAPDHLELVANPDYVLGKPTLDAIEIGRLPGRDVRALSPGDVDTIFRAAPNLYSAFSPPITSTRGGAPIFGTDSIEVERKHARSIVARVFGRPARSTDARPASVWVVPQTQRQAAIFRMRRELLCDGPLVHDYPPPPAEPETPCDQCAYIGNTGTIRWRTFVQ